MIPEDVIDEISYLKQVCYSLSFNLQKEPGEKERYWQASCTLFRNGKNLTASGGFSQSVIELANKAREYLGE